MKICKVIGNVVSTEKDESLMGFKLLIVQPVDMVGWVLVLVNLFWLLLGVLPD
ncbi:MAG: EutN/CcmL family microcompartment protein [Candidatus Hodarchaeales archaeon]